MSYETTNYIFTKYADVINWKQQLISSCDPVTVFTMSSIMREAKEYTIETTGCTPEEFNNIFNPPDKSVYDFENDNLLVVECYFDYLDSIRKAH